MALCEANIHCFVRVLQGVSTWQSDIVKSVVWAKRLYEKDFGYSDLPIFDPETIDTEAQKAGAKRLTIYDDNTGCIEWSRNPVDYSRSKHVDVRYHYVRAKVRDGTIKLVHRDTDGQLAGVLTKYLAHDRFRMLRDCMLGA